MIEEKIAEILEQPCDTCELEDNCDCRVRGIICPYQEKKAEQIKALFPDNLFELLEKLICPDCKGQKTTRATNMDTDPPDAWIEDCPTCKGTGNRYEIALIDTKAELPTPSHHRENSYYTTYGGSAEDIRKANFHKVVKRL